MKAPVVLHSHNEWAGHNGKIDENRLAFYTFCKCDFTYRLKVVVRLDPTHRFTNSFAAIYLWVNTQGWTEVIFLPSECFDGLTNIQKVEEDLIDRTYTLLFKN